MLCRMRGHGKVENSSTVVCQHHKHIQDLNRIVGTVRKSTETKCGSRKFRWGREAPGAIKAAFHNQGMLAIFARNSSLRLCQAAVHSSRAYTLAVDRKREARELCSLVGTPFSGFQVFRFSGFQVFRFSGDPALVPLVPATNFRY